MTNKTGTTNRECKRVRSASKDSEVGRDSPTYKIGSPEHKQVLAMRHTIRLTQKGESDELVHTPVHLSKTSLHQRINPEETQKHTNVALSIREMLQHTLSPQEYRELCLMMRIGEQYPTKLNVPTFEQALWEALKRDPHHSHYFLDERKLQSTAQAIKSNFLPEMENAISTYAVKANFNERVIEILNSEKFGYDCASINEIRQIFIQDPKANVAFNHPIKNPADIEEAMLLGVKKFVVEDMEEALKIINIANKLTIKLDEVNVRLRTNNEMAQIKLADKFGASIQETKSILTTLKHAGYPVGIAIHTGSQNKHVNSFYEGIGLMMQVAKEVGGVKSLNVGGGIPVNYDGHNPLSTADYLQAISDQVYTQIKGAFDPNEPNPRIYNEIGRATVAECYTLGAVVTKIGEKQGVKTISIGEGIFGSFSDRVIHNWDEYFFEAYRSDGSKIENPNEDCILNGRSCDSGDIMTAKVPQGIKSGDILVVRNAGAYMDSQSTYFNGHAPHQHFSYNLID